MSRIADLFWSVDSSRSEAEGRHYYEVVENYGEDDERTLYVTTWHQSASAALLDAREWMAANGVTEGD
jgi:hypothetical protein